MRDENILYWIWLSEKCGIASKEFGKLAGRYESPYDLYRLDEDEIEHLEGIGAALKGRLCDKSLENAYSILRYCKGNDIEIVSYGDERYPMRLRSIENPPVLLYVLGKMPNMNQRLCIGIVGTRKMSEYGRQTSYKISYELAAAHAVIVSGMALGVDAVAACGALAAGGSTVAVLGCGISVVYPKEHAKLMKAIAKHGAVVTEYPPFERPVKRNFPKRNRIISGLCQGVLVVEGDVGSGALITATKAIVQGRELFALPGKVDENNSVGPNELIRNGARVALCADDLIRHYDFLYHDMINYKEFRKAKTARASEGSVLRKYGVSPVYAQRHCEMSEPLEDFWEDTGEDDAEEQTNVSGSQMNKRERTENGKESAKPQKPAVSKASNDSSNDSNETDRKNSEGPQFGQKGRVPAALLDALDANTRAIFENMPIDCAVTPDKLILPEMDVATVITSLTLLEMNGLISSLPGGMYIRK